MFLSKKNAIYFNKPKHTDPLKPPRILGGTHPSICRLAIRLIITLSQYRLQAKTVNYPQNPEPAGGR